MDNCTNPATELSITVGSHEFPRLHRKTSHVVLLAVYHVCDYIILMFPEGGQSFIIVYCQEVNINVCVLYLNNIYDNQNCRLYASPRGPMCFRCLMLML